MPRLRLEPLLGLVLLGLSAPVLAQVSQARFDQLDADHNGVVDLAEYDAGARVSFAALDLDHDGFVTLDEMRASIDPNTGGIGREGTARARIEAMDKNYDKLISEAEFIDYAEQAMAQYDRDGDGRLTRWDFSWR